MAALAALGMDARSAVAQQPPKEIIIGYSISLTGKFSTEASDVHRAYQMWAEETNKRGGIAVKEAGGKLPVRLVHYDDNSDTSNAIRNYERLIAKDQVNLLFSPWGSGHNFAISALTEKYKVPIILATAAADRIFQRDFKYIFSTTQMASRMYDALADYLGTVKDQVKTVAIAYENFLFTQSLHDVLKPKLEKAGFQIVIDEQYPLGGQDFTSRKFVELARALATRPKLLLLDELLAGLNPIDLGDAIKTICRIRDDFGITILWIEHIMKVLMDTCEHIIVLHHGQKLAEGAPREVANEKAVADAYFGKKRV
jgi:ABC-type branched-subunit amino acid transport system ATPase component